MPPIRGYLEDEVHERRQLAFYFDPACDIKTTLRRFGEAYIGILCRPRGGSAARMVFAIAERMPEIGRRYYALAVQKTVNCLAEYLDGRVKQQELVIDDCQLAAMQFMLMCQASLFLPFIYQVAPAPSQERITRVVNDGTDVSRGTCCEGNLTAGIWDTFSTRRSGERAPFAPTAFLLRNPRAKREGLCPSLGTFRKWPL